MANEELLCPMINADTGEEQDTDWWLSGESIILMDKLDAMPVLNTTIKVISQYTHERHNDFCTGFAPYNAFCTIRDYEPNFDDIDEIVYTAQNNMDSPWKGPGNGRAATYGYDAARKTLNPKYPDKAVTKRKYDVNSVVRDKIMEKRLPVGLSIIVDSKYWKDIKDGKLDGDTFSRVYGHADRLRFSIPASHAGQISCGVGGSFSNIIASSLHSSSYYYIEIERIGNDLKFTGNASSYTITNVSGIDDIDTMSFIFSGGGTRQIHSPYVAYIYGEEGVPAGNFFPFF